MKKKILTVGLILIIFLNLLCIISNAEERSIIQISKDKINLGEEFNLIIGNEKINIAAGTIWIYFDNEKLECLTKSDKINIVDNRIIYTWISEDGRNRNLENLLNLSFKSKKEGIASFTIIGEFYDENGNEKKINGQTAEINITKENELNSKEKTSKNIEKSNSVNLAEMRLNKEGIVPNFSPSITDYYMIVDEDTENLRVTAIPESDNAEIIISGNKNLKNELNNITIIVKNGTNTKKYSINVTKTAQKERANTNLETLAIENYELMPEYQENIIEYNLQINNTEEKLNILAIPENMKAKVEIRNNENLKYGENIIEIIVTAQNEITKRIYKINVYKRNEEEQKEYEENQQKIIEEAENKIEKISNTNNGFVQGENEQEIKEKNEKIELEDKLFKWIGTVLSIIIFIFVIIRIGRDKINQSKH